MAVAAQHTRPTTAHDWPPVKPTAALAQSPASLTSPKARDESTSGLPAALSLDSLASEPLPTPHVAAAAAAAPTAAALTAGCTTDESASGHAPADEAADEAASSLITAAGTVLKPQSAAARSAAKTENSQPAGPRVGQMDVPPTTTLMQAETPLVTALVQSSGTGCQDVLEMSEERPGWGRVRQRDSWVSRSFRGKAQSSCTLQLLSKTQHGMSIKVCAWFDAC